MGLKFLNELDVAGNITLSGTVDGIDIATRDAILTSTTTTAGAALPKAGGTMSDAIAMGTNKITGMGNPTANQDAATKAYVDGASITGTAATVTGAAQTNITSLGTLTALDVDGINLNAKTITITGDTDDTFSITTGAAGATTLTTIDDNAAAGHFEIAADGNITLDAAGDIVLEAGGNDVTVDTDNFTIESATTQKPKLTVNSTNAGNKPAEVNIDHHSASPANNDYIGVLGFNGNNDDGAGTLVSKSFAQIICAATSVAAGAETGTLELGVKATNSSSSGGTPVGLSLIGTSSDNEIDVNIASGAASTTTIAGTLTMGTTAAITNAGLLSVAAQTNITSLGTLTALTVDNIGINGDTITASGDLAIVATGNDITVDTDHFVIESAATADPTLTLKSTTNSNVGSSLEFISDKGAAGADNDVIGSIKFIGDDTAQVQTQFARIVGSVSESADSDEAGKLEFFVAESNGTSTNPNTVGLLIEGEHATDGQIDVTIAAGAASTTTVAGNLELSGTVDGVDIATRDAVLTSTTTTAGAALPKAGGAMTGAITTNSTFDGVDIATRDAVLTSTTTTANAALPKAGGTMSDAIAMGTNKITGMGNPTANQDAATKAYVDGAVIANTDVDVSIANLKTKLAGGFAGNAVTIGDGNDTTTMAAAIVTSNITAGNISTGNSKMGLRDLDWLNTFEADSAVNVQGDVIYHSATTSTIEGAIYYMASNGNVILADANAVNTSSQLLMVAVGVNASKGMLLRGMVRLKENPGASVGLPIYLSGTPGVATGTAPSASGDVVRVLGYQLTNGAGTVNACYFNPDNTWVELA